MLAESSSNPGQPTAATHHQAGQVAVVGRVSPLACPTQAGSFFAITPGLCAWSRPAQAAACPAGGPPGPGPTSARGFTGSPAPASRYIRDRLPGLELTHHRILGYTRSSPPADPPPAPIASPSSFMNNATPWTLPHGLRPPAVPADETIENPTNHRAASARILVVDDEREIRDIVSGLLRGAGYQVDTANDGAAGWALLRANPYDLLITDHMMPKVTGLELLRRVRAVPLTLPCLLISGQPPWDEDDLASLVQPGAVVPKPFGLTDLLAKTRELLSGDPAKQSVATATPP